MSSTANWQSEWGTPKYVGLARHLLRDIAVRRMKPGDRLASEHELVRSHNMSRVTVRQALQLLENDGYVSRQRARGTFVERQVDIVEHFGLLHGAVLVACSNAQSARSDEDVAFSTVLRSMERTFAAHGFSVQILGLGEDVEKDRMRLQSLLSRGELEGLLTIGHCLDPHRDLLSDIPLVTSCTFAVDRLPWVGNDVRLAAFELTRHLIEHGHENIAMICGPWMDREGFSLFAEGYRDAFAAASSPVDRAMMIHALDSESLSELTCSVLTSRIQPTAVICENWQVCRAVLRAADTLKLRIPDDISVVGFGQNVLEMASTVELTAYVPANAHVGAEAAELLIQLMRGEEPPLKPKYFPGRLVVRDSVRARS
jgi:GntR family transcriptional regulator, arabinose operon transcriptional repressor